MEEVHGNVARKFIKSQEQQSTTIVGLFIRSGRNRIAKTAGAR